MNILVTITGLELKDEDMVKLDMHIIPPSGRKEDDWKSMLREIKAHRDTLEKKANKYRKIQVYTFGLLRFSGRTDWKRTTR